MNKYKQELIDYNLEINLYPETIKQIMNGLKQLISAKTKDGNLIIYNATSNEVIHCLELMNAIEFLSEYEVEQKNGRVVLFTKLDIWD